MNSGVTTRCTWPGRRDTVTELTPFRNFLLHSYTYCSDRDASPYRTFIRRWISMGFTPSLRKKRMTERSSSLVHVASGAAIYTIAAPSCCFPPSYCHLSATLQTNSHDNRAGFRIFITLLRFPFDSSSYILFILCIISDRLMILNLPNALTYPLDIYITMSQWTFLHVSACMGPSSWNQPQVIQHKRKLITFVHG